MANVLDVNVVRSDLVEDAYEKYKDYFPGNTPVPMHKIVDGYVKSLTEGENGLKLWKNFKNNGTVVSYYGKNTTLRSRKLDNRKRRRNTNS